MTDGPGDIRNLPVEVKTAIRKEAISQIAKWFIGGFVAIAGFAIAGWWFILEPKLKSYIADAAGGVPVDGIIASSQECSKLPGRWAIFKEGTGRFIIGAGTETVGPYASLTAEGSIKRKIATHDVLDLGGNDTHLIRENEMPLLIPGGRGDLGHGDQHALTSVVYGKNPNQNTIDLLPPYIGLYLCKKI
ncbi:hypothetical protein [Methylobacterium brachiatum]|uniref:Uncharacterized protein n=1 Tax=Methylobacterium brachiatum TaxID=269660 RepID=A0ABV1R4A1_9HYPH